jgi:C-terminal processing protease CtpA/Prc
MTGTIESFGVLVIRITIIVAASILLASEVAFSNDQVDYWATETKLNEQHLKNYFTQERCYKDENSFLGCIEAVNVLFFNSATPVQLTNNISQKEPEMKDTIKEIEGIKLQKYLPSKNSDKSFVQLYKENSDRTNQSNKSWKKMYLRTKESPISFENLVSEALSNVRKEYTIAVYAEAINMYLKNTIDPHTYIASEKQLEHSRNSTQDSFVGVGVNLERVQNKILLTPLENSPALKAGMKYMDVLTHVDNQSVAQLEISEASKFIKGPENTTVTLRVLRGKQTIDLKVSRGKIVIKNIEGKLILDQQTNAKIAYIKIRSFMVGGLCKDFLQLARSLRASGAESLILDLRDNGGGSVSETLCMAASYIDQGKIILKEVDPEMNVDISLYPNIPALGEVFQMPHFPKTAELYELYNMPDQHLLQNYCQE